MENNDSKRPFRPNQLHEAPFTVVSNCNDLAFVRCTTIDLRNEIMPSLVDILWLQPMLERMLVNDQFAHFASDFRTT